MSRLRTQHMQVLIADIASGRVAPGAPLPREADLAVTFGVSRGTARECVRGLPGNRSPGRMTEPIHRALATARRPLARPELRVERSLPEHQRVLSTIAAGDALGARAAMEDHLRTVEGHLREFEAEVGAGGPLGGGRART